MKSESIDLGSDRDTLPFAAGSTPTPAATEATLASVAASLDRLIGMQLVLARQQEGLESRLGAVHREMQSNMNAYLGWTQEFANRIKAQ